MDNETKIDKLILCEICHVSLPEHINSTITITKRQHNGSLTAIEYIELGIYCNDCAKIKWEELKQRHDRR